MKDQIEIEAGKKKKERERENLSQLKEIKGAYGLGT